MAAEDFGFYAGVCGAPLCGIDSERCRADDAARSTAGAQSNSAAGLAA